MYCVRKDEKSLAVDRIQYEYVIEFFMMIESRNVRNEKSMHLVTRENVRVTHRNQFSHHVTQGEESLRRYIVFRKCLDTLLLALVSSESGYKMNILTTAIASVLQFPLIESGNVKPSFSSMLYMTKLFETNHLHKTFIHENGLSFQ